MIAVLTVAGLMVAYGLYGAGRHWWRAATERRLERAQLAMFERAQWMSRPVGILTPTQRAMIETPEERAARLAWHADCDDFIAAINVRFDRLLAGMPRDERAPLDPSYWPAIDTPEHGPTVPVVDLTTLAEFDPRATLDLVAEANALPAVFSWTTGTLPLVERPVCVPAEIRPPRRRSTAHAARATSLSPLPIH